MSGDAATFFTEYGESSRYTILEVIGRGSYGVVCSAIDNTTGACSLCAFALRLASCCVLTCVIRRACGHQEDQRRIRARFGEYKAKPELDARPQPCWRLHLQSLGADLSDTARCVATRCVVHA
jgi:serine/threonine protein kinase